MLALKSAEDNAETKPRMTQKRMRNTRNAAIDLQISRLFPSQAVGSELHSTFADDGLPNMNPDVISEGSRPSQEFTWNEGRYVQPHGFSLRLLHSATCSRLEVHAHDTRQRQERTTTLPSPIPLPIGAIMK